MTTYFSFSGVTRNELKRWELTLDFWSKLSQRPISGSSPMGKRIVILHKEGLKKKPFLHFLSRAGLYLFNNATELNNCSAYLRSCCIAFAEAFNAGDNGSLVHAGELSRSVLAFCAG